MALLSKHKGSHSALRASMSREDIRDLRYRLSPAPRKPLSQQRFSELLNVSWSTVARWESGGQPDVHMAEKLARLRRALDVLGEMINREDRLAFFEQPHPLLLDLRPIDLLSTAKGAEVVIRLLEGAATGAFA